MDQVSRPVLIAFAATLAFLVLWFVALRPKPVPVAATPLAPTQAIPPAQQAAAASDAANAQAQAAGTAAAGQTTTPAGAITAAPAASATTAAPAAGATTAAPAATTPAPAAAAATPATAGAPTVSDGRRDDAILRDVRAGKVVVVLFWNAQAADDIATRGAIRDLDLHGGKVAVHIVPIGRVGEYPSITQGVTIAESPTTLVIDRKHRTRVIAGLSEPQELAQAVGDARAGR